MKEEKVVTVGEKNFLKGERNEDGKRDYWAPRVGGPERPSGGTCVD